MLRELKQRRAGRIEQPEEEDQAVLGMGNMKNNPFCITDGRKTNSSHRLFYQAMLEFLKFD